MSTPQRSLSQALALRDTPVHVWRVMAATTFRDVPIPVALAALDFAKALGVPPLGGHVWAIEVNGAWQLTPGVQFYRLMAARSHRWAGLEWQESDQLVPVHSLSLPEWIECKALRFLEGGTIARFPERIYAREAVRTKRDGALIPTWRDRPRAMLRVRAESLALRSAFPEWISQQEMGTGPVINGETGEVLEHPARHLSSEDIAAGFDHLPDDTIAPDDGVPF